MKVLKIGIASLDEMRARTMAIARGELKLRRDDPKIWFTSAESIAKVLATAMDRVHALLSRLASLA